MLNVILDSSATYLTVGIMDENGLIDYASYPAWQSQSEKMIPELKTLLEKNNFSVNDISGVIVGVGPGSYTGLRIALTSAKVIALSLNIPLYPVSSLWLLKEENKPTICLMNARSGRSYFAVYEGNKVIEPDQILTNDKVNEYISSHPDYVIKGELAYLSREDNVGNIAKEAASLFPYLNKIDDPLTAKPVYMKG
ncbi:MAG: tRNA (adenosine(37)-N6)-threonylcarbamoyltransferase complex dimerization subunit type 1 TsaB [Erysipelotrichaceae bacterium]|jgi:tRNA threonylcarbamoyl adenosine modification protein YeaZ|nr:tRNA (adenosine(37)-N6)-threonylcarbamoyltransferase complex dimerization subunit type 1 TsaB [Erysipelotrichaceae bacterium]